MRLLSTFLLLLVPALLSAQEINSFDQLLVQVKQGFASEQRINRQVLQHASNNLNEWQQLVDDTEAKLSQAVITAERLRREYDQNNSKLKQQSVELKRHLGDLDNIYSNTRQSATSLHAILKTSLVSADHPQLLQPLATLAGKEILSEQDLGTLWQSYLEEMTAGASVSRFDATLINTSGQEETRSVVRAGPFSAVSNGAFLKYLPGAAMLVELSRQPAAQYRDTAAELQAGIGTHPITPLDPSRGALLETLTQKADMSERVAQGGTIGQLILLLGAIGLLIVAERVVVLIYFKRQIKRQQTTPEPGPNPLGLLMRTYRENQQLDSEHLQLKLNECLLSFVPRARRGLTTLNIIATVTPLLGLLGTVTGMIDTFQSITLFGNGDPKIMSGGISQALVTTELGLAVAIPIILLHSHLGTRSSGLLHLLQKQMVDLVAHQSTATR